VCAPVFRDVLVFFNGVSHVSTSRYAKAKVDIEEALSSATRDPRVPLKKKRKEEKRQEMADIHAAIDRSKY
jgi:hypothetical protein